MKQHLLRRASVAAAAGLLVAAGCAADDTSPAADAPTATSPPSTSTAATIPRSEAPPSAAPSTTLGGHSDLRPALPRPSFATAAVNRRESTLPVDFQPVVWTDPPPRPALQGPLAVNDLLTNATIVGEAELAGAEDIAAGMDGHLYTGTIDGGLWRLTVDTPGAVEHVERVATLPGRALGLDSYSESVLVAAVPGHGLMAVDVTTGESWTLADRIDGNLVFFADAVAVADDGTIYVTEASTRYLPGFPNDFLDGRPHGRLLRYEPATGTLDVVADGIHFANGVDIAPDESYALVAESFRFRLLRIWLHGDRAGTIEPFGEPLINGADNLRIDDQGRVWVGGSDLRSDATDALLTNADVRRSIAALTDEQRTALRAPYGFAVVLDPHGRPLASFHDTTGRVHSVSSVLLHGDTITFGRLNGQGVAQITLPPQLT